MIVSIRNSLVMAACVALFSAGTAEGQYDFSQVTSLLNGALNGQDVGTPIGGAALQVVQVENGASQVLYAQSFGTGSLTAVVPVASAAKTFSTATIMSLYDQGLLSLDSMPGYFYPQFATGQKSEITLQELLSHTSGLQSKDQQWTQNNSITLQYAVQQIGDTETLAYAPGTAFNYSNVNFQVAGGMAELAGSTAFTSLFQTNIANKLGLQNTQFVPVGTQNPEIGGGDVGYGINSGIHDYTALMTMLLQYGQYNGQQVISTHAVDLMTHDERNGAPIVYTPYHYEPYGLGVWIDMQDANGNPIQVSAVGGYGYVAWVDYQRDLVGVLQLTDYLPNVTQLIGDVQAAVRAQVNPVHVPYYWDANGANVGSGNVGGSWNASNWTTDSTGSSPTTAWVPASDAVFSAGTDGIGAWTVSIGSGTISVGDVTVQSGNVTLGASGDLGQFQLAAAAGWSASRRLLDGHPEYQHRRTPAGREQPGQRHAQHGRQRCGRADQERQRPALSPAEQHLYRQHSHLLWRTANGPQ